MHADSSIPEFLTAAIERGNQLIVAREQHDRAVAAQRLADELAELAERWQPILATIRQATPTWVHEYIVVPDHSPDLYDSLYTHKSIAPTVISLSALLADVPDIRAWANPHNQNPSILFDAGRYTLNQDEDSGEWYVATTFRMYKATNNDLEYFQPDSDTATDDFHVALAQAVANRIDLATLRAEAAARNDAPAAPVAEPAETTAVAFVGPNTRIANALESLVALYEEHLPF